jgi:hypothetical protein
VKKFLTVKFLYFDTCTVMVTELILEKEKRIRGPRKTFILDLTSDGHFKTAILIRCEENQPS